MIGSGLGCSLSGNESDGVSILVVLDDWFGPSSNPLNAGRPKVSILVVLDDWFGLRHASQRVSYAGVSILVVLDDWFGLVMGGI